MSSIDDVYNLVNDLDKRCIKIQENHEVRIGSNEKDLDHLGNKIRGTTKLIIFGIALITLVLSAFGFLKG